MAPGTERGVASLTAKGLDPLGMAIPAISDEGVDLSIADAEVRALRVGTSEPFGIYAFGCSPPAFHFWPGTHRSRRWPCTRRGSGGETTGVAIVWAAGLQQTLERRALGLSS